MFWQETTAQTTTTIDDSIVDLSFSIRGKTLKIDHSYDLYQALSQALPILNETNDIGIHPIITATSGNGWYQPNNPETEILYLSKRSKLILRLPKAMIERVQNLTNQTLDIAGSILKVGQAKTKTLIATDTLFSRHVVYSTTSEIIDEQDFLNQIYQTIQTLDIQPKKLLCGRSQTIKHPQHTLFTCSVMIADLSKQESITLQQHGIGQYQRFGCGLWIPHKGITPVGEETKMD